MYRFEHLLINAVGFQLNDLTAANAVKIGLQDCKVWSSSWPVRTAGFTLHPTSTTGKASAHCLTRTTTGSATAPRTASTLMDHFYGVMPHDRFAHHDVEGIAVRADDGHRFLKPFGPVFWADPVKWPPTGSVLTSCS